LSADVPHRSPQLLSRQYSRLAVIDMQEKLLRVVRDSERVIECCDLLIRGAQALGVPVFGSEQYPAGLGSTVEPLRSLLGPLPAKVRFSAAAAWDWSSAAGESDRPQVVLAGIETHVCVLQTAFDLLSAGFAVHIVADAVSSRREIDARTALARLRDQGASITTVEAVLFEWCEAAGSAEFKQISSLVKSARQGA
jgi:nicotinamidase-related amidase